MAHILVSGSLAYDHIMVFPGKFRDHFVPEKLHSLSVAFVVESLTASFGGTAGNIAYNLRLLNEHPHLLACVGNDFARYEEWLTQQGIDPSTIQKEPDVQTSAANIITDKEDSQITAFYPGAGARLYMKDIPQNASLAIVAPSNAQEMVAMPKKFHELHIPFFYDPGQQITALSGGDLRAAVAGAEVVFGNDYEVEMMLRKLGWNMQELVGRVKAVVTTLGAEGSIITTKHGETRVKAVKVFAVDPTGAGDAYRAGFAKGFVSGMSLEASAKLASVVAAFAVEKGGTQEHHFTIDGLRKRHQETYGEALAI